MVAGVDGVKIPKEPWHNDLVARARRGAPSSIPESWSEFDSFYDDSPRPPDWNDWATFEEWFASSLILSDPEAYIIPIEDVFASIESTLSSNVSLPTLQDWQLHALRRSRKLWPDNLASMPVGWLERHLELEYLLAEKKARLAPTENHDQQLNPAPCAPLISPLGSIARFTLEDLTGLSVGTMDSVLLLGALCPLSLSFRIGLRQWLPDHRRNRLRNRLTLVSSIILARYLGKEAGENILGLVLVLWKSERHTQRNAMRERNRPKHITKHMEKQTLWLAHLLSSLFSALRVAPSSIPSVSQLHLLVHCIIAAFKDKDMKEFLFVLDSNLLIESSTPLDGHWTTFPPRVPNAIRRAIRWTQSWITDIATGSDLLSVADAWDRIDSGGYMGSVSTTSRLLIQLMGIATGDSSQLLVCRGSFSGWVAFYASVVLGLEVELRAKGKSVGNVGWRRIFPFRRSTMDPALAPPSDVVAYIDAFGKSGDGAVAVSECLGKESFKALPRDLLAVNLKTTGPTSTRRSMTAPRRPDKASILP